MLDHEPTLEEKVVKMLRTVYDPEIPVNIYDLGLIYLIDFDEAIARSAQYREFEAKKREETCNLFKKEVQE